MIQHSTSGMRIFIFIWLGQMVSLIGSALTSFPLGIWVYQNTNSVTLLALILLCATLPSSLISPMAGVLVDRWQRLLFVAKLEVWHICLASAFSIANLHEIFQE